MQYLAVCVAVLIATAYSQTGLQFKASFTSYNDPLVNGIVTGTINYDATNNVIRNDYNIGGGIVQEYFDFTKKLRYLFCTACDAQTWTTPIPVYHSNGLAATGGSATINGRACTEYSTNDAGDPVSRIWTDGNGLPCRAVYTTGKTLDFTQLAPLDAASFTVVPGWNCPAQTCNRMIDFVLIFDESGSIIPSDFQREKAFGVSIASNFVFGPNSVGMGLIQFSGSARFSIHMTYIQQSFINAMNAVIQLGGSTCIGCGLQLAVTEVNANGRPGVQRIFILLTDGMNNVNVNTFPSVVASVKNAGIIIFAIGVGPQVDANQINFVASSAATSFPQVPSFSALQGIVNQLVTATCLTLPGTPCGQGCQGFCSCKGTCVCPTSCEDNNPCTIDTCTNGVAGSGCTHPPFVCNDNNFCTTDTCNPASGCVYTPITCTAPDICHTATCVPATGCQYPNVNCNLNSPCYADSCNVTAGGCVHTPVDCNRCLIPVTVMCTQIPCFNVKCNVTNGQCGATPIDCNDNNACTTDACDPATGMCTHTRITCDDHNLCTHKTCDINTGCVYTPYTVADCDDQNICTTDTCNPAVGCVHTNVNCTNNGNPCLQGVCDPKNGCGTLPFDCLTIPRIARFIGNCYQALCDPAKKGCFLDQLPGTVVDQCGVCNGNNGCKNLVQLPSNVPFAIAGGSLAAIVVGAIILFVAIAAFGGKKGYDIWLAHRNNMSGASTNPLYHDNGLTGRNPMYSDRATRV